MLALTNNAELVSAAESSRVRLQIPIGKLDPLGRMLARSTVATSAASSVGDTHARSSGGSERSAEIAVGVSGDADAPSVVHPCAYSDVRFVDSADAAPK